MKKLLLALLFVTSSVFAEATFDQIEGLIQQKNYAAAASGLEVIIKNHPQSSKAFYAMAQAQAGLGNQEKAQKAFNIATGLNPTLDFAPASSVASLKQAITPQTAKIEAIEESHTVRNTILVIFVMALGFIGYMVYRRNKEIEEKYEAKRKQDEEEYARAEDKVKRMAAERERQEAAAKEAEVKAHKNYGHERFDPQNPDKLKTVKRMKEEAAEKQRLFLEAQERREAQVRADAAEASARMYRTSAQAVQPTHTTVVNNSSNDLLTGVLIGNMMGSHSHDTTRIVEREVVRDTPKYTPSATESVRSSSWDDTPSSSSSRSSSWDDDSSSSSKSSSSWSSSSDSSSSSSWSSSSDSSSSSSSSWD